MNIGIYWGYHFKVDLDGAGAGRYIFRLIEGLLRRRKETNVHILATPENITQIAKMLARLKTDFPERIAVYCSDDPAWINANIPADLWIVPWVGLTSAQYLTKPLVVCVHDLAYIHFPELEPLGRRVDATARILSHKAEAVICNSDYIRIADALTYLRLPAGKIHVIRPAAPVEEYSNTVLPSERDFRAQYRLDKNYFVFPSIATWPHKNHIRLIEAFLKFKETQATGQSGPYLVFTDHIENFGQKNELSQLISQYDPDICGDIVFIGRLPSRDVPALYKYAAGTAVPSLFEGGCPFPILESLIMGTPVAFGRIAMAVEVIRDLTDFITFDPYDIADMQRALGELWQSGRDVAAKQKAALGGFIERTWQDVAREYYAVFDKIMGCEIAAGYEENIVTDEETTITAEMDDEEVNKEPSVAVANQPDAGPPRRNIFQEYLQAFKTALQNIRLKF